MKILCVIDSLGSGGAQRQLVNLAIGFKQRGHEVSFLVYHDKSFFKPILDEAKIPITFILEKNYFLRILKIRSFIRKGNFDAVLSFLEGANFIAELSSLPYRKWKLVVGERSANPNILKSFKLRFYRWFHLFADCVVSNSNENISIVKKANPLIRQKKFKVIYNLIDFKKWHADYHNISKTKSKIKILIAASHQYIKNAKGLIHAIQNLPKEIKQKIIVHWYGDESPDNSYKETLDLISKFDLNHQFILYPATQNIKEKMLEADIIGLFSFYEGLPNVICEAMALGKPIIASAVSDVPILISNKNCLFNPKSTIEIQKTLEYIISLSQKELEDIGKENKIKALKLFDKDDIINSYLSILKKQ
jgi:glycosyltransferase involved in cell wall biosynthesis